MRWCNAVRTMKVCDLWPLFGHKLLRSGGPVVHGDISLVGHVTTIYEYLSNNALAGLH